MMEDNLDEILIVPECPPESGEELPILRAFYAERSRRELHEAISASVCTPRSLRPARVWPALHSALACASRLKVFG